MAESRLCCLFLLVTFVTRILSVDTYTVSKNVCLGDSVQLFQNVSLTNRTRTIVINQIYGDAVRKIAQWSMSDSVLNPSVDKRFEKILSLDKYGNIWMRNVQNFNEGRYTLLSTDDTGALNILKVDLIVLVAPSLHCKPNIDLDGKHLIAFLNVSACGRPAASSYFLGYNNQNLITVQPEKESGPYHACIESPSLRCVRRFKATDFCSSRGGPVDQEVLPKINLTQISIPDSSITLQCKTNGKSAESFRWRRNGLPINNNVKYSQNKEYLTIKHLNIDDQYDIYTCLTSGGQFESDPYNIETSGPSVINVTPSIKMVKERDTLNISCLSNCYPLCDVEWSKLEPSSDHDKILLKQDALLRTNVTRKMSGQYSCKVKNLITGAFLESIISLAVQYGPNKIWLNTSRNIIELDEFESITILCTAECFPPCLINWSETSAKHPIRDAELKLVNVSTNGTYTCIARNPDHDTIQISKTINIAVKLDETKIPNIDIFRSNVSDSSVVLKCHSFRKFKGKFSWMVNGSLVKHSNRYSPGNDFLSVRHLTDEDQNNLYTCKEPGSKLESDPFRIKISGPTSITFNPKDVVIKEHNALHVSCLTDCTPLCSFQWFKLDPFSGLKNVLSEEYALQITEVTRDMSGNYSCKVQNIITGKFDESSLSLDILYGPDQILLNTSNKIIQVDECDYMTVVCAAECFPPCIIIWTESYRESIMQKGADLKLVKVKMDGNYTCHATNPKIPNSTILRTIVIKVKYDATIIPRIALVKYNTTDSSIVLKCISSRTQAGRFSWRVNGSMIINSDNFFEDNQFLFVRHVSAGDPYNSYTCTEPESGFESDTFLTNTYGPVKVVVETSNNKTEVDQFSSTGVSCSADCFPPCLFRWTFSYIDAVIEDVELKIHNVTSNGTVTCHATNPMIVNATVSATIDITVKADDIRHKTPLLDKDKEAILKDFPLIRLLQYVIPGIAGFGMIVAVVCCLRKKNKYCSREARLSNHSINAHSEIGESHQAESLSEHYWTIVSNARGEYCTALERDINMELRRLVDPTHSTHFKSDAITTQRHRNSEELEVSAHSVNSEIETDYSYSLEHEGYINPIPSEPTNVNEHCDPNWSRRVEFNKYMDPIPSESLELDIYIVPSPSNSTGDTGSHNDSVFSNPGMGDEHTDSVHSDVV